MLKKVRDSLFYIGIILFSVTAFGENLFFGKSNVTEFIKGMSIGFEFVGLFFVNRKKES